MLELTDMDLKQTRFYQDVFTEGHQEGEVTLIVRQLQRRCGELPSTIQEQIRQLSVPQLEALGEALLEFSGLTDLTQWLAARGSKAEA